MRMGKVAFLRVTVALSMIMGACTGQVQPSPSGMVGSSELLPNREVSVGASSALDTAGAEPTLARLSTTANQTRGDTNVPLTSGAACLFDRDNPYPCCVNSPGQYGNCTGGAWQQMKAAGWGNGLPRISWGDARRWRAAALAAGYLVDSIPTLKSVGVANNGPTLSNHVAVVTAINGSQVTTIDQQCGYQLLGGNFTMTRSAASFNDGYIRAPIPLVNILVWSGATSTSNGGTLTVSRGLLGSPVTVNFGFSLLRANIDTGLRGPSTFAWTVSGSVVSTAGTFAKSFSAGTYPVSVRVANGMGVTTIASATLVVR
ncbi:MAG: CHAP domain-containing protein [Vicinamibacterales bacterium]